MAPHDHHAAQSALNLRLVLASGGTVLCLALGLVALATLGTLPALLLLALALVGAVDAVVVLVRRRERAKAHRGADHQHDSLFE